MVQMTKEHKQIIYYGHYDFLLGIEYIENKLKELNLKFENIYCIPRGGFQIGLHLSHRLELPMCNEFGITNKTLIVDDICDEGITLLKYPNNYKCVLCSKDKGHNRIKNLISPIIYKDDAWIMFYWEKDTK